MAEAQTQAAVTPQYRQGRHFLWFAILGYSAFRISKIWPQDETVLLVLYSSLLWGPPAIILHELGHALACLILDTGVTRIKLGLTQNPTGPHLAFRSLGFQWELYALPVSGSVHHRLPSVREHYRARCIAVTAAGPAVSLALAIVSLLCFAPSLPGQWSAIGLGWAWANFLVFVLTMLPFQLTHRGKPLNTDFNLIRKHLALTDGEIEQKCYLSQLQMDVDRAKEALEKMTPNDAVAFYESNPERLGLLLPLVDKLEKAKDPRQTVYLAKLIERPRLDAKALAVYLDNYITRHLEEGTINGDLHFDALSGKLLELSADSLTARGTRGSVLIDLGRIDEGKTMLLEVLNKSDSVIDKTYSNIFIALAEMRTGRLDVARDYATAAGQEDPNCAALKRVDHLLKPSAAQAGG